MSEVEIGEGAFENPTHIDQSFDTLINDPNNKKAIELATLQDERTRLDNPNLKLSTIEAALDDKMDHIDTSEVKKKAIETTLAELPVPGQEKIEVHSYSDPQEKVDQIAEVIQDKDAHIHAQFASIQAILGKHTNSSNPWVQAHHALDLIEDSSRRLIKSEEKRQKELRTAWQKEMEEKAQHHHNTARKQEKWRWGSGMITAAAFTLPFAGNSVATGLKNSQYLQRFLGGYSVKQIDGFCKMGADTLKQSGSPFIQECSQLSQIYSKNAETLLDWSTNQERQDLDQQGQVIQEARQNDNSLKERHLEVIKTLTAQIVGR